MQRDQSIPEQKCIVSSEDCSLLGHQLVEIEERIPGVAPTDVERSITDGPTYKTRYWRCRYCGQERNRHSEFIQPCDAKTVPASRADGGYSIHEARTHAALAGHLTVRHVGPGDVYTVDSDDGPTHRVDLVDETCTCRDNQLANEFCKHLRRVDIEVRTGTIHTIDE